MKARNNDTLFGIDVSTAYTLLKEEKEGIKDYDFLLGDLTYFAGTDDIKTAFFAFQDTTLYDRLKLIINGIGTVVQPMTAYLA